MAGKPQDENGNSGTGGSGSAATGSAGNSAGSRSAVGSAGSNRNGGGGVSGGETGRADGSGGSASGATAGGTGGSGSAPTTVGEGEGGGAGTGSTTGTGGNRLGAAGASSGKGGTGGGTAIAGKGSGGSSGSLGGGGKNSGTGAGSGAGGSSSVATGDCTFTIGSAKPSTAIATVGIIEWSTSLGKVDEASIEFKLQDAAADELNTGGVAPVDVTQSSYKTLLLGLKGERSYKYRITAKSGSKACTSEEYDFEAGAVATSVPTVKRTVSKASGRAKGFIVTAGGMGSGGGGMMGGGLGGGTAMIIDADGEVVWWAEAPSGCSRAIQSYEGTTMWMASLNMGTGGEVRSVSMDGLTVQKNVSGLSGTHHDITAAPGGVVTCLSWSAVDKPSDVIEHSANGTNKTVFTLDSKFYAPSGSQYHSNAIHYVAADDSYTISDRYSNLFIKVKRSSGEVLWQLGGSCTNAKTTNCVAGNWQVNHGHHLVGDGTFLFFNNGNMGGGSTVYEYTLTETGSFSAKQNWSYSASGASSSSLGDVQRLPNGNTLVTFSNQGVIHEIDSSRQLVQTLSVGSLGYADFRESLYGAPARK